MTRIFHRLFLWKWIPCQAVTFVLCFLFRPKTVHCSTKNTYTSEITFLALVPWSCVSRELCSEDWASMFLGCFGVAEYPPSIWWIGVELGETGWRSLISQGTKDGLYSPHIRARGLMYSRTRTITYCFDHLRVCGDHGPHSSLPGLGLGSRALGKWEILHRFNMTSSPASHSPCILPGYAQLYSLYDE